MRMRFVKVGCEAKGEWICCQLYVKDDPGEGDEREREGEQELPIG